MQEEGGLLEQTGKVRRGVGCGKKCVVPMVILSVLVLVLGGFAVFSVVSDRGESRKGACSGNGASGEVIGVEECQEMVAGAGGAVVVDRMRIEEWNLEFVVPGSIRDVEYVIDGDTIYFFAMPAGRDAEWVERTAFAILYRSSQAIREISSGIERRGRDIGDGFYYYTAWSFSNLATGMGIPGQFGDDEGSIAAATSVFWALNEMLNTIRTTNPVWTGR
ncbi:hypothetical protein FWD07_01525 [Candidatus Saccharibacteria bacterium]|nr:hypothetical protein [Candidatus Saccharibacteria bacterium]